MARLLCGRHADDFGERPEVLAPRRLRAASAFATEYSLGAEETDRVPPGQTPAPYPR